jgi:hypothetical protein
MSTTEFPEPGPGARIHSQIEIDRAQPLVLRNSRFLLGVTFTGGLVAAFFCICMLLMVFSQLFPLSALGVARGFNALQWAAGALGMLYMCLQLWGLGRKMAGYQVRLDSRGADFILGTKKTPSNLFLAWDKIAAIKFQRVGSAQQYFVQGADGSEARFSSYTFFRPKKVATLIAARSGLSIQKV